MIIVLFYQSFIYIFLLKFGCKKKKEGGDEYCSVKAHWLSQPYMISRPLKVQISWCWSNKFLKIFFFFHQNIQIKCNMVKHSVERRKFLYNLLNTYLNRAILSQIPK